MEHPLLDSIHAIFPLTSAQTDPVRFKASGMKFTTTRYDAQNFGSVSLMQAKGFFGLMRMTTLILNPFSVDAPLLSIDRISAMGRELLYVEMFDTMLDHKFEIDGLEAVNNKYKTLPDQDPGKHWYDHMRVGTPLIKKDKAASAEVFTKAQAEYLDAYLAACKAAPACDEAAKREKARVYSEGLLKNGGPATDPVKKALGVEKTTEFFRNTLFGTN